MLFQKLTAVEIMYPIYLTLILAECAFIGTDLLLDRECIVVVHTFQLMWFQGIFKIVC